MLWFGHHSGFWRSGSSKLEITNAVWVASQFIGMRALKLASSFQEHARTKLQQNVACSPVSPSFGKPVIDQHVDPSPQGHGFGRHQQGYRGRTSSRLGGRSGSRTRSRRSRVHSTGGEQRAIHSL